MKEGVAMKEHVNKDEQPAEPEGGEEPDRNQKEDQSELLLPIEQRLVGIDADDVDIEEDLASEQLFDTQHGEGHTFNPYHAQDQGLTYTPPTDPPVVPSQEDPQGVEIAAGFAPSMEESEPNVRDLPPTVADSDLEIQENIYQALRYNSETAHLSDLTVQVRDGVALLHGTVTDRGDISLVYEVIHELDGVRDVRNHLEVGAWSSKSESDDDQ
jgi:hypothetical protein